MPIYPRRYAPGCLLKIYQARSKTFLIEGLIEGPKVLSEARRAGAGTPMGWVWTGAPPNYGAVELCSRIPPVKNVKK